jgi:hypothetical protein
MLHSKEGRGGTYAKTHHLFVGRRTAAGRLKFEGGWRGQHSDVQTSIRCEHSNVGLLLPSLVEFSALSLSWLTLAVCSPSRCVAPHVPLSWPLAVFPMLLPA